MGMPVSRLVIPLTQYDVPVAKSLFQYVFTERRVPSKLAPPSSQPSPEAANSECAVASLDGSGGAMIPAIRSLLSPT